MLDELLGKRVLLLQGPMGPCFARMSEWLRAANSDVTQVTFNLGDRLFGHSGRVVDYRGRLKEWPDFVRSLMRTEGTEAVVVFGDCRAYHRAALQCAEELGVSVFVLEEGYVRPDFVTFERGGVNGYSSLSRDPNFYLAQGLAPRSDVPPVERTFWHAALYATIYAWVLWLGRPFYRHYEHHRDMNPLRHLMLWALAGVRRLWRRVRERRIERELLATNSDRYFLVPLQVHNDAQVIAHSAFKDVPEFIETTLASFARQAPGNALLVFKHHPVDRAYRDYSGLLAQLARKYGIADRVLYLTDAHLPSLFRHARGVVVINSTTGLSAIHHGVPIKTLGSAVYDMPGLTHQGSLDDFWSDATPPNRNLYFAFRGWLEHHVLVPGSVWAGVHWDLADPGNVFVASAPAPAPQPVHAPAAE